MNMNTLPIHQISEQIAHPLEAIASPQRCHPACDAYAIWKMHSAGDKPISPSILGRCARQISWRIGMKAGLCFAASQILPILTLSGELQKLCGLSQQSLVDLIAVRTYQTCACPHCQPAFIPAVSL
jgi:hypothetical protein